MAKKTVKQENPLAGVTVIEPSAPIEPVTPETPIDQVKRGELAAGDEYTIQGEHAHAGAKAAFVKKDETIVGKGLLFERLDTKERFFVFNTDNLKGFDK